MKTISPDGMMLDGNKSLRSFTHPKEIMSAAKTDIANAPKELTAIGSDAMLVQETENSSTTKQLNEVMKNIDMDVVNVPEQATILEPHVMLLEETSRAFTQSNEVHYGQSIHGIISQRKRTHMLYLKVVNAYIYCISACDHLRDRAGGKVYLGITVASDVLTKSEHHRAMKRVHLYLKHDMVLFPINISKTHWFLVVVNAKKRVIQILDSLGGSMGRSDLTRMLQGLEKHLKIASQMKDFDKGVKWMDLNVTT